ncbi:MAG: 3-deoxy-7-phosphoheptulonate synthase [Elusimicrobia bacterium]|nr:3-deoxy-7-phosphoheptulonate synthase [Elusimicrobiota bacterium]
MHKPRLNNVHISGHTLLPTPAEVRALLPASAASLATVAGGRRAIEAIVRGGDERLLLVVGPCSIHDPKSALEYARRLRVLAERVSDRFLVVMRVYFEKPRTTVGWKGLINDPSMDDSFRIEEGLTLARRLLLSVTALGLPTATEALDPITPQYLSELVCWHAIGARTIESQTHRELASGLSSPVGFKNGTDGNVQVAIDAMKAALRPHSFLGVDPGGRISVYRTRGNRCGHVVLRGGKKPNYDAASVAECAKALKAAGLPHRVMVDCSHGNSSKDYRRQPEVFNACLEQWGKRGSAVMGMMVESNLFEGNQPISKGPAPLKRLAYGVSVTDACLGWEATEKLVLAAYGRRATSRA